MSIYELQLSLMSPRGLEELIKFMGEGAILVVSTGFGGVDQVYGGGGYGRCLYIPS